MKRTLCLLCVCALAVSCGPKSMIQHLSLEHDGLRISLGISADNTNPSVVNGKLRVVNASSNMMEYGNYRLFLEADGRQVVTSVMTRQATAYVDTKPVHLSPGDSLDFFVAWDFGAKVNFRKAAFKLHYVDTAGVQSAEVADAGAK
jgi:hypothetical protein